MHSDRNTVVSLFARSSLRGTAYCSAQAAATRLRADRMAHPELRTSMLRVAALWEALARRHSTEAPPRGDRRDGPADEPSSAG